jgi:hypothetical protein
MAFIVAWLLLSRRCRVIHFSRCSCRLSSCRTTGSTDVCFYTVTHGLAVKKCSVAWRLYDEPGSPGKTVCTPGPREKPPFLWRYKKTCFPVDPACLTSSVFSKIYKLDGCRLACAYCRFVYLLYSVKTYDRKRHFQLVPVVLLYFVNTHKSLATYK